MTPSRCCPCLFPVLFLALLLAGGCARNPAPLDLAAPSRPPFGSDVSPENQVRNLSLGELVERGRGHLAQGNLELAAFHFNQALAREPDAPAALTALGDLFWQRQQYEAAATAYRRALVVDPDNLVALTGLGRILRTQGFPAEGGEQLGKALLLAPEQPEILTELAVTLDHDGRHADAEALYRKVVALAPGQPAPLNNLGFNLLLQERYGEALPLLSRALELSPNDRSIKNNLAAASLLAGDTNRALSLFGDTVGEAGAWNNLGYIHMLRGEWDKAERAFRRALDLNPVFYAKARQNLERVLEMKAGGAR